MQLAEQRGEVGARAAGAEPYGQYCPIAGASEVLAERWTPIILRNLLLGSTTFSEIAAGAPGLSRTPAHHQAPRPAAGRRRPDHPNPNGRVFRYQLTDAGKDLAQVMQALGTWGERWMELAPEHLDPGVVLHSWVSWYLARCAAGPGLRAGAVRPGRAGGARPSGTWAESSGSTPSAPNGSGSWGRPPLPGRCRLEPPQPAAQANRMRERG